MKMRKLLAFFLTLTLVLSMTACGNTNKNTENSETISTDNNVTEETNETETTENHEHTYKTEMVNATCKYGGYVLYTCECGDSYKADEVPALGHSYGGWNTTTAATTTSTGTAERICELCGDVESKTLEKIDESHTHSYTKKVVAPTCTAKGYTVNTCSCGDSYTSDETAKTEHSYKNKTTAATCTKDGYTTYTCSCGNSYITAIAKLGHSYTSKVVDATCTKDGYTKYTCSRCSDSYQTKISATGHKYGGWNTTKPATTTATGKAERKCSSCGNVETKTLDKLAEAHKHSYSKKVVESTCTAGGYTIYTCSCGDSYTADETAKKAHSYTDTVVKATCTTEGYTKHTCKCGDSYTDSKVSATGHSYSVTSNTATCTKDGIKTETCGNCGNKKTTNVKATGHNTKTETKAANCVEDGYTKVTCKTCGTTVSNTVIKANGSHTWETKTLAYAAQDADNTRIWEGFFSMYLTWTDHNVQACTTCCFLDPDTIKSKYTEYEAATIMLGYVNDLRREVYGTNEYDMVIDNTLMELAKIRAKEISVNYSHETDTFVNAAENIASGLTSIRDGFISWRNSSGHYNNMIKQANKYFAYATYHEKGDIKKLFYGVQLFWTENQKLNYDTVTS